MTQITANPLSSLVLSARKRAVSPFLVVAASFLVLLLCHCGEKEKKEEPVELTQEKWCGVLKKYDTVLGVEKINLAGSETKLCKTFNPKTNQTTWYSKDEKYIKTIKHNEEDTTHIKMIKPNGVVCHTVVTKEGTTISEDCRDVMAEVKETQKQQWCTPQDDSEAIVYLGKEVIKFEDSDIETCHYKNTEDGSETWESFNGSFKKVIVNKNITQYRWIKDEKNCLRTINSNTGEVTYDPCHGIY
ncbi:MAG: hypothetical protein HQM16_01035 [Deltaproteobacteria bacterium]|nr:hypothetical protein [Deltaproteobacteria bacterium]